MEIEVLAPVGGEEQLIAAVKAGADAVYLGTENFNARRNAHNFTDLSKMVEFCHNHGVKVFVTLNTVIKNKEIGQFVKTVREIADSGADAVIVQDLGGISLIKEVAPDLPLHASTQMTVHNLSGVKALEKLGFTRAVLARELSEKEKYANMYYSLSRIRIPFLKSVKRNPPSNSQDTLPEVNESDAKEK